MGRINQHNYPLEVVERRESRFLRLKDAARDLGCSVSHVRGLAASGKVQTVALDGLLLIPVEAWDVYVSTATPVNTKARS